jgi:hypothetical protein
MAHVDQFVPSQKENALTFMLKILEGLEPAETKVKFEGSFDFLELKATLLFS